MKSKTEKTLTMKDLTEDMRSEVRRAVHRLAEDIYTDYANGCREMNQKPSNLGFVDGICDMMYDNVWAGQKLLKPATKAVWDAIPYKSRLAWVNKECRYI